MKNGQISFLLAGGNNLKELEGYISVQPCEQFVKNECFFSVLQVQGACRNSKGWIKRAMEKRREKIS